MVQPAGVDQLPGVPLAPTAAISSWPATILAGSVSVTPFPLKVPYADAPPM
jgi:hypothetical protein